MSDIDNDMEHFVFVWNVIDQEHLQVARYIQLNWLTTTIVSLTRRRHVPRIYYFVERVILRYNLDDFGVHFRISRDTFDEMFRSGKK